MTTHVLRFSSSFRVRLGRGATHAAGFAVLALAVCACSKPSAADAEPVRPVAAFAATPQGSGASRGTHVETPGEAGPRIFEISGVAAAARTATLASKGSGILRSLKVREGDRVKSGQVLAVLDATDLSIRAQSATVAHAIALAALENAKDDMNRAGQLFDAGALADQPMEKAKLGLKLAELQVQGAAVGIRMAQQALSDATLRAPFDGVVTRVLAEEGNYLTMMPPSPIFVLSDTDFLDVHASVPERKLSLIKKDMPVVVALPAVSVTRNARIDRLADVIDPMTRSLEVIVRLDNKDHALPAGLFATVAFPGIPTDDADPPANKPPAPVPSPAASVERGGR